MTITRRRVMNITPPESSYQMKRPPSEEEQQQQQRRGRLSSSNANEWIVHASFLRDDERWVPLPLPPAPDEREAKGCGGKE